MTTPPTTDEQRERVLGLANLDALSTELRKILTSLSDDELYMLRLYLRLGVLAFLEENAAAKKG